MSPDEIKALRFRLRLSQSAFARKLGVSVDTVRSWEGKRSVPPSEMNRANLLELAAQTRRETVVVS